MPIRMMRRVGALLLACLLVSVVASAQPRLATFIVKFQTTASLQPTVMDLARTAMGNVDAYYREQSYQKYQLTSDVFGVYTLDLDAGTATRNEIATAARAAAVADGMDLSPYTGWLYVSPTTNNLTGPIADASGAWVPYASSDSVLVGWRTAAHELGHHLFGLPHAPGEICTDGTPLGTNGGTCTIDEYGNTLSVMGLGYGHFSAYMKTAVGWIDDIGPQRRQFVTADGDYLLTPLETADASVKTLVLSIGTRRVPSYYYLEYRQPIGFDEYQPWVEPANVFDGVVVGWGPFGAILLEMTPPPVGSTLIATPALTVGSTYLDSDGGVRLTVLAATSVGAVVRVKFCSKNKVC